MMLDRFFEWLDSAEQRPQHTCRRCGRKARYLITALRRESDPDSTVELVQPAPACGRCLDSLQSAGIEPYAEVLQKKKTKQPAMQAV